MENTDERIVTLGRNIAVSGKGVAEASPDSVKLVFGISIREETPNLAMKNAVDAAKSLIRRLREAGVAESDMQTLDLSLRPVWKNVAHRTLPAEITGYSGENSIVVWLKNVSDVANLLEAGITSEVNLLNGVYFEMQDPQPLVDKARQNAVRDAQNKAELYAKAAGVSLGEVLSIEDVNESGAGWGGRARERGITVADSPIAEGKISEKANVMMVWSIKC